MLGRRLFARGYGYAPLDARKDWHDWGIYEFVKFEDDMTVAVSAEGNPGYEAGFNVYADLGPERGALLGSIRWDEIGITLDEVDKDDCLVFEDGNGDGLGDIGVKTKNGDTYWYLRNESRHFVLSK